MTDFAAVPELLKRHGREEHPTMLPVASHVEKRALMEIRRLVDEVLDTKPF